MGWPLKAIQTRQFVIIMASRIKELPVVVMERF